MFSQTKLPVLKCKTFLESLGKMRSKNFGTTLFAKLYLLCTSPARSSPLLNIGLNMRREHSYLLPHFLPTDFYRLLQVTTV